jgi:hypothetical protein
MSIESAIRTPLQTSLSTIAANVYNGIPETMTSPSIVMVPGSPYLESTLINGATTKVKINFQVTGVVGYANNAAALTNLEDLMISIISTMPSGYTVGDVTSPTPLEVGAGKFLTADLQVSTYYTD